MRIININEPLSGLYADDDFKRAFDRILSDVESFIPADRSHGNLSLKGNGALAVAKAKILKRDVENLIDVLNALTIDRK